MKWVAFFSQTGSEIVNISRAIDRWPDLVVTNKQDNKTTHVELVKRVRLENTTGELVQNTFNCPLNQIEDSSEYSYTTDAQSVLL